MNEQRNDSAPSPMQGGGFFVPYPPLVQASQKSEINLADIWHTLREGRRRIVLITLATALLATVAAFVITPIYQAQVLLSPVTDDQGNAGGVTSQLGGLAALAGINVNGTGSSSKDEAVAVLQSRVLTDLYVKENNLLPILFASDWDQDKNAWKDSDPEDVPTLWDAFKLIEKKVRKVDVDKKTGLVTLSVEWKDPELAARWAAGLVARANAYMRQQAVQHAENNLTYLQDQAKAATSVELQQAIYRLMEAEVKKGMLANANAEFAFKVIDPPVVPEEKVRPKRLVIIFLGGILGLIASSCFELIGMRKRLSAD